MKHIIKIVSEYEVLFWAMNNEHFIQSPQDYKEGDIIITSNSKSLSNIIITSREETTFTLPTVENINEFDVISTRIKYEYLDEIRNLRSVKKKNKFIAKKYLLKFNGIWGKDSDKEQKFFRYGFKTFYEDVLNPTCDWTRIESPKSDFTSACGARFSKYTKYCSNCGGKVIDKPIFHITGNDEYSMILQKIKDDLYRREDDIHRFTKTLKFIEKVVNNYSKYLKLHRTEVLKALEKNRDYWSANYYLPQNFPLLNDEIIIFENKDELQSKIDFKRGFRCPSCGDISNLKDKCYQCDYSLCGFLNIGETFKFILKSESQKWDGAVYGIFPPISLGY